MKAVYNNNEIKVHVIDCKNREFWVGACYGISQIFQLVGDLKIEIDNKLEKEKADE